jgi:threonine/homoserine/homoserine lactone efflux protein
LEKKYAILISYFSRVAKEAELVLALSTIFFTSFVIALSGALMPGPLFTVTVSESARRGFAAGPLLIVGHGLLELALVFALVLGLGPWLQKDLVFIGVGLVGSVILVWMAWAMFRSLPTLTLACEAKDTGSRNLVTSGVLLSLANPYWTIWWASIGLGYILASMKLGAWGIAAFFAGHIAGDFAWYGAVSAAVWKGKTLMSDRAYRWLIGGCAGFLVAFSAMVAWAAVHRLLA